jgi:PAS domain S-box-containing protein
MNAHSKKNSQTEFREIILPVILTILVMILIMTFYEFAEESFGAGINHWETYALTILFGSFIAFSVSYFILKKYRFRKNRDHDENINNLSLLNSTIESTADGILVIDNNGKVSKANKKFEDLWGIPQSLIDMKDDDKLLGFVLDKLTDPEAFIQQVKELYAKPEAESFDILEFKDSRTFERLSFPQMAEGKIIGRVWSFRDITDHKRVEDALRRERILLRTVIDNLPDAIYAKDTESRKTLSNRTDLENMQCANEEDALGKTDFDFFPRAEAEAFYADDQNIIKNGQAVINREESFSDQNGNKVWLLTSKLPRYDEKGNIIGLIGIGRNITDRKKAELIHDALYEISESANKVSDIYSLYKKIHEVVKTLMSGKNIYLALYEESTDLLSFPYFVDKFDPPQQPKKPGKGCTEYVLRKGEPCLLTAQDCLDLENKGEIVLLGSPSAIWLGVPLKAGGKTIGVIVVQDYENENAYGNEEMQILTFVSEQIAQAIERKRAEEEIKQYTEELRETNQTKDKLFSIIAHDLRSPFGPILNFSEIINNEIDTLEKEELKLLAGGVYTNAKNVFTLMENLLQWSRMQSGVIQYKPAEIDLKEITDNIIHNLQTNASQKHVDLENRIAVSMHIKADDHMLGSVLRNLISNAIKFTSTGGKIFVGADRKSSIVEVFVEDNGVGISADRIDNMFNGANYSSTKGTNQEKGTGLGLILCKEFVERHGGSIWVNSEPGKGSKFVFTIPLSEDCINQ